MTCSTAASTHAAPAEYTNSSVRKCPYFPVANGPIRPSSTQPTAMLLKNVAANLRCSFFAVLVDTTIALYFPFGYGKLSCAGLYGRHLRGQHCPVDLHLREHVCRSDAK